MLGQGAFCKDALLVAPIFELVFTTIGKVSPPTKLDNIAEYRRQYPSHQGNRSIVLPR